MFGSPSDPAIAALIREHAPTYRIFGTRIFDRTTVTGMENTGCLCGEDVGENLERWPEHIAEVINNEHAVFPLLSTCHARELVPVTSTSAAERSWSELETLVCAEPGCGRSWTLDGRPIARRRVQLPGAPAPT